MKNNTNNIKHLYKYRSLFFRDSKGNIIRDKKGEIQLNNNTMNMLKYGEIFLSNPNNFNDPFDCWIPLSSELTEEDVLFFLKNSKDISFKKDIKKTIREKYKNNIKDFALDFPKKYIETEHVMDVHKDQFEKFRIYCLSKTNLNILLWSHYAQNHEGICIGIKIHKEIQGLCMYYNYINKPNQKLSPGYCPIEKVNYSKEDNKMLPGLKLFSSDDSKFFQCLYHKSVDWKYEEEYRIILLERMINGNKVYLENDDVNNIYFGLKTPNEVIKKTINELKNYNPTRFKKMNFYKMNINRGYYELRKDSLEKSRLI